MTHKMTQKICVNYYQAGGAPLTGIPPIRYSLKMEAETYEKALEYLGNIMRTCNGVITLTTIEKIDA